MVLNAINGIDTSTVVDRDLLEFDQLSLPGAALDDEVETNSQRFQRLHLQVTYTCNNNNMPFPL